MVPIRVDPEICEGVGTGERLVVGQLDEVSDLRSVVLVVVAEPVLVCVDVEDYAQSD